MSEIFKTEPLVEGNILKGAPSALELEELRALRQRIVDKIDHVLTDSDRRAIMSSDDPIRAMFEFGIEHFTQEVKIEGIENIPEKGRVVIAQNHPFPFVDDFALMRAVTEAFPERPWAFIGNVNSITKYFPDWEKHPSFSHRIIPVRRVEGNSWGKVANGSQVIQNAAEFLRMHRDPMLFMAPDGPDSILQDRIAAPHIGFARIARMVGATVVPALFTGKADLQNLTFNVNGKILTPLPTEDTHEMVIIEQWSRSILEAHARVQSPVG